MRAIRVVDPYLRRYQSFQSRLLRWAMSHPVGLLGSAERVAYSAAVDWKMVISGKLANYESSVVVLCCDAWLVWLLSWLVN